MIHQVTDNTLTLLLDLLHFTVTGYAIEKDKTGHILHLFCRLTVDVGTAPIVRPCPATSSNTKTAVYVTTTSGGNASFFISRYVVLSARIVA